MLANGLEIDKLTKQMKLYPANSLEEKYYLGVMIRKIVFIPPPTEANDDLEGPMLMSSRNNLVLRQTTENCTTDSQNVTTCTNSTAAVPSGKGAATMLVKPKNLL